jgi:hypothetical protein
MREGAIVMPTFPSIFPLWRVALTAVIAGSVGFVLVRWCFKELPSPTRQLIQHAGRKHERS